MKIFYIARFDQPNADDEGAIFHALTALGHEVHRVREVRARMATKMPADFLLFHHWHDDGVLDAFDMPKVCWCFDLISFPSDPTLQPRCEHRKAWLADLLPRIDLGFLTDGDFVKADTTGKLLWLPQGADERVVGKGTPGRESIPLLFTGIGKGGGIVRESFVNEMASTYGSEFCHVSKGTYGRDLANLIATAKVVVAPDGPIGEQYWSNRIYVSLGFGACLLHPWCKALTKQYVHGKEIVFYNSRKDLHFKIVQLMENPDRRRWIADAGLKRTIKEHLYRHRCEQLIETVKERLL